MKSAIIVEVPPHDLATAYVYNMFVYVFNMYVSYVYIIHPCYILSYYLRILFIFLYHNNCTQIYSTFVVYYIIYSQ